MKSSKQQAFIRLLLYAENWAIHDVNTIANYDPDIVMFLGEPIGSALERINSEEKFVCSNPPEVLD